MPETPSADEPEWVESLWADHREWAKADALAALSSIAAEVGDVMAPMGARDAEEWQVELGGERPPAITAEYVLTVDGETLVSYEDLDDPGNLAQAANGLLQTLHWLYVGLEEEDALRKPERHQAVARGALLVQWGTERFADALGSVVPNRLTAAVQNVIDKLRNRVQRAVGRLWSRLSGMSTLDSWQVSGSIGTALPGFTGSVSLGLTFT